MINEYRKDIPEVYRGHYEKAIAKESMRSAITAMCLECVCWQRIEITNCTDKGCPLYRYRPYQV